MDPRALLQQPAMLLPANRDAIVQTRRWRGAALRQMPSRVVDSCGVSSTCVGAFSGPPARSQSQRAKSMQIRRLIARAERRGSADEPDGSQLNLYSNRSAT